MVTGKNRKEFKKWYESQRMNFDDIYSIPYDVFMAYNICFQIGVYLAYYDSKGIFVDSEKSYNLEIEDLTDDWESGFWYKKGYHVTKDYFVTRNEAYKEAFKQADKLINEKI